jgi:hypothetical protein
VAPKEDPRRHEMMMIWNGQVQLSRLLRLLNAQVDGNGMLNATTGCGDYNRIAHRGFHRGSWRTGTATGNGHGRSKGD